MSFIQIFLKSTKKNEFYQVMESKKSQSPKRNSKFIKISNVKASDNKLEVKLEFSKEVAKYFFKNHFEVYYDKNIENVDESILSIPAVCVTIQVAWATGADLYVDKLDETFLSSLPNIRKEFQKFFPKFSSSGDIHVKEPITNKFYNKQIAVLYGGGIDSLVSYLRNKNEHPILITLLKPSNSNFFKIKKLHRKFAGDEGVEINFIESNVWDNISDTTNNFLLGREFETNDWWGHVSHGLIIWGLSAPITVEKIGKIVFASTYTKNYNLPYGSHFLDYINVSWADVDVFYDSSDLSRQEKIRYVLKNPGYQKHVRSCLLANEGRVTVEECGNCEKCLRTTTGFILEGIDPNECNFNIKNNVLDHIKTLFTTGSFYTDIYFWKDIQNHIPNTIKDDEVSKKYHAKEFFEWFRGFNLANYQQGSSFFSKLRHLFYSLKYDGIDYPKQEIRLYILKRTSKKKR